MLPEKPRRGPCGSPYQQEFVAQARKLCAIGGTGEDLAEFFEVSLSTIRRWLRQRPEFAEAVKAGRARADERVARSLYRLAVGYTRQTTKTYFPEGSNEPVSVPCEEHVPPDKEAAFRWLKLGAKLPTRAFAF